MGKSFKRTRQGRVSDAPKKKEERRKNKNKKEEQVLSNEDSTLYVDILDYLNNATGKKFRLSTKSTRGAIHARITEGFFLEDFKKVIDTKTAQWKDDPKMSEFLRPQTLFGTKFEAYLNQKDQTPGDDVDKWDFK
jgi:uncharacterized phage protein (TIGR02220 family)